MRLLKLNTQVHKFDDVGEFAQEFQIGAGDFVLTHEFLYAPYMESLNLQADFKFQEHYGAGEPSNEMIDKIFADIQGKNYQRVIAIGGGTVIDIAKLFVLQDTTSALDVFEQKIPLVKDKELIVVPTTCGTGSEVTNISIAEIKEKQTKMGLAIDALYPDHAVLIPALLSGLPFQFFVTSSIDALIHACEAFVSPKANSYTDLFSSQAIELILRGYAKILEHGEAYRNEIMEDFVVASNYAGIAFGNAGVGAVHALSYPLGGKYHVPHGEANYQFFVEVFETYDRLEPTGKIKQLRELLNQVLGVTDGTYHKLSEVLDQLLVRQPLREYGMQEEEIEGFAHSVIEKQQRLLVNNYVPLSVEEMIRIYRQLF